MNVAYYDHRGMAQAFVAALADAGHQLARADHGHTGDVLIVDYDHPVYQHMLDRHANVLLIPHGAGPVEPDVQRSPNVRGRFVTAAGPAELAGDDIPSEIVGWPWCDQRPFRPTPSPKRILFAPTHPDNDGHVDPCWRAAASHALDTLTAALTSPYTLTYRPGPSTIQEAAEAAAVHDLVVAAPGTIVAVAVACGVPTVVYGQKHDPSPSEYPFDLDDGVAAVHQACTTEAVGWRRRWVGHDFDARSFADLFAEAVASW